MDAYTSRSKLFQSTPSVWRKTTKHNFVVRIIDISIHSLRVEGDHLEDQDKHSLNIFQSTPSVWRETKKKEWLQRYLHISIHSLRVEGDPAYEETDISARHFNPLPPCGGRLVTCFPYLFIYVFQSTPSVWRETKSTYWIIHWYMISIHSLRVEGDSKIAQLSA